jgi:hypothetical protein
MSRPRQKKQRRTRNPLKQNVTGQETYTETRTNIGQVMSGNKFDNRALAGLAAREDLKQVRLRSASRNRNEGAEFLPYRHPMLILFKGRRHVRPRIVPVTLESLNHEDSFILVNQKSVFVFIPELTNVAEKAKVKDFSKFICETHDLGTSATKPTTVTSSSNEFWEALGGSHIPELKELMTDPDEDDEEYENSQSHDDRCWKLVTDKNGIDSLQPELSCWGKSPSQSMLNPESVFVFEFGHEVYLWIGSQVHFPKRRSATKAVKTLWSKFNRSESCFLGKLTQHRETSLFTEKFSDWRRPNQDSLLTPIQHRDHGTYT